MFFDLRPEFESDPFKEHLLAARVDQEVVNLIISKMGTLNRVIREDKSRLGSDFEIDHSFFCPQDSDEDLGYRWYESIIRLEIAPLLREYWFDDLDKAESLIDNLLTKEPRQPAVPDHDLSRVI